ncbi:MAG: Holliday junction branch migration protein RuvA [Prevotella sp.]|nr:Holliday junction branch migration protein RuvA [Prevotella sp.]
MIEYVKGEIAEVTPAYAVIDVHGVGYGLNISLNTYSAIQGKQEARLWVYESIREDAYVLFGFGTREERDMFLLLITVSGVGANTARVILSELSAAELCNVIATGNERILKGVKGIGLKTAQRIIVDLKDKIPDVGALELRTSGVQTNAQQMAPAQKQVRDEAVSALTMLGFAPAPTQKVVNALLKDHPDLTVEQVVKMALKQIK